MKKIYFLTAAVLTFVSATANEPLELKVTNDAPPCRTTTVYENAELPFSPTAKPALQFALPQSREGMKKAEPGTDWIPLGVGKFTDDFLTIFDGIEVSTWDVEIYENAAAPGYYAMMNPWASDSNPYGITAANNNPWIIDARDPNKVRLEAYVPGFEGIPAFADFGTVIVAGWPAMLELANQSNTITAADYGTLVDGALTFPASAIYLEKYNGGTAFKRSGVKIMLPGAAEHSVTINMKSCAPDNTLEFRIKYTAPEAKYLINVYSGRFEGNQENYEYIAKQTTSLDGKKQEFGAKLTPPSDENAVWTVFAVGVNSEGKVTCGDVAYFDVIAPQKDKWRNIGTGKLTDDLVSGHYKNLTSQTMDVQVEENIEKPGYYRLVDPYAKYEGYENDHENDHTHYIYINAMLKNQVYVEESPIGLDYGYGTMRISSLAYNAISNNQTPPSTYYGKMTADNKISFPMKSIVVGEYEGRKLQWFNGNINGKFAVEIPKTQGVDNIAVDNEESAPVYFTLQGVQVNNPTAGQMVIERRGNKVTKTVIR